MNTQRPTLDKIDEHNRQQLSALVDGELGSDQARFLLRRLEHDPELQACQERWSLLGDVLRGQAVAPAPADFAARVSAAVAREPAPEPAPRRTVSRVGWRAWGGGAALAASVAVVALFMGRQSMEDGSAATDAPTTVIASEATLPLGPAAPAAPAAEASAAAVAAVAPAVAVASATRAQEASARRASATRSQQAARAAQRNEAPLRAVAAQAPLVPSIPAGQGHESAFGNVRALQARPWPRATLAPTGTDSVLNASFSGGGSTRFYPFEPRLQDESPRAATRE